jgi:hypothetical protein
LRVVTRSGYPRRRFHLDDISRIVVAILNRLATRQQRTRPRRVCSGNQPFPAVVGIRRRPPTIRHRLPIPRRRIFSHQSSVIRFSGCRP